MPTIPDDLRQRLRQHQQEHLLAGWDRLEDSRQRQLLERLRGLDLDLLRRLYEQRDQTQYVPPRDRIEPVPVIPRDHPDNARRRQLGEEALRRGEVAALLVAGGQGSRLGFEHPKGMYAVGPVSRKTLFQLHAEKVLALRRRSGARLPFLVMTSPATHDETVAFFSAHGSFGLPPDEVHFFRQGTMPALDMNTGRLLLEAPGRLFLSPDGHGGTLTALAAGGLLGRLRQEGVRLLYYFQVDNPLLRIADPLFLGHHLAHDAEVSVKVVPKRTPADKLGNLVSVDGKLTMIEYSDLPDDLARATDEAGRLRLWAGSPAIHIFDHQFLERVTAHADAIPFHVARKKVPHVDEQGRPVEPRAENALKFERFIFDVLPLARRWAVVETTWAEEFAPLKNAEGPDSPATVEQAISDLAADWLARAGVQVPRRPDGSAAVALEISPLFALDPEELAARVKPGTFVQGPTYFG